MIPNNWTLHKYNLLTQVTSGWLGWYEDETGQCVGFSGMDGSNVAFNALDDSIVPL